MPSKPPDPGSAARCADPAGAFEFWLIRNLHSLYSSVAAEPIPPELLRLLDSFPIEAQAKATRQPRPPEQRAGTHEGPQGFEQRVRKRAYFLWLDEGRPSNRAAEHWRLASAIQAAHEARDDGTGRYGRDGILAEAIGGGWTRGLR